MSTAKLLLVELARHDGPAKVEKFAGVLYGQTNTTPALRSLEALYLVVHVSHGLWQVTRLGRDVVEGRAEIRVRSRCRRRMTAHGVWRGRYLAATWLASLPRDIRITPTGGPT